MSVREKPFCKKSIHCDNRGPKPDKPKPKYHKPKRRSRQPSSKSNRADPNFDKPKRIPDKPMSKSHSVHWLDAFCRNSDVKTRSNGFQNTISFSRH